MQILYVDVDTVEGESLYRAALEAFGLPRGVPHLFIDRSTMGGSDIPKQLPSLVETGLAEGGTAWPPIPGLDEYLAAKQEAVTPAATTSLATPRPSPTYKACHVCEEELPLAPPTQADTVVQAVLFTSSVCGFCNEIVELQLPPAIQEFGVQLKILEVDVNTPEGNALFEAALEQADIPRGTPMIFVGNAVLGGINIPSELPGLVRTYLAQGGVGWPAIPGIEEYMISMELIATPTIAVPKPTAMTSTPASPSAPPPAGSAPAARVRAVLFWQDGCPHCHEVIENVLPPLQEKYGQQLEILMIEVVTLEDVDFLYEVGAAYGIPRERVGVPFLILGEQVLIGSTQIPAELPGLIELYLAQGGVDWPYNPILSGFLPTPNQAAEPSTPAAASIEATPVPQDFPPTPVESKCNNGFVLAVVVLAGMVLSLLYALGRLVFGVMKEKRSKPRPPWQEWLIPILCLIGLGVAGYLSYIEITYVPALCGPVGECNSVQQSSYTRLWGVLPIGVLGAGGYIAILVAWWAGRQKWGWFSLYAPVALFGMTFFGTIFSIYLTYLEPFVIKAVCIWCITSSILMTLLLLVSTLPALRSLIGADHAEETIS